MKHTIPSGVFVMGFGKFVTYCKDNSFTDIETLARFKDGKVIILGNPNMKRFYLLPNKKGKAPTRKVRISQIEKARKGYKNWSANEIDSATWIKVPDARFWRPIGECSSVQYESDKEGDLVPYIHEFEKRPKLFRLSKTLKGKLLSSVYMVSPVRITTRGIVDG